MDGSGASGRNASPGEKSRDMRLVTGAREDQPGSLPERYAIRQQDENRVLVCVEAPTLSVRVERDLIVGAAAARKSPPGSIYLDGAAQGEPFLDTERHVFNLDHHEGCVRAFTLATCEQAIVLVRMGLDLRKQDWVVYANEPDLDTIFAIWVLLNHIRLNDDDPVIRQTVMPLLRLQGAIDAHGLELQELVGFPPKLYLDTFAQLEHLRAREVQLKREGTWQDVDFLAYTAGALREIDLLIYSPMDFEETLEVQELARARIAHHWLVIACRSQAGIYEVEKHLRRLHGERLGIIALEKRASAYTIRRVNHFLPVGLETVYEQLNAMDPKAGSARSGNRWGGSGEIGGSPRVAGTGLTAQQIVEICSTGYNRPRRFYAIASLVRASCASLAVLLAAIGVVALHGSLRRPLPALEEVFARRTGEFAAVFGSLVLLLLLLSWRRLGDYGLKLPARVEWWILLPAAATASLAGGAWFPGALAAGRSLHGLAIPGEWVGIFAFAAAAELLFRGLVHGILARMHSTQKSGGRWYLSRPVAVSSLLYAFWALAPFRAADLLSGAVTGAGTLLFGVCCGVARERSGSLLPPILIHCLCLLVPVLV